MCVCVCLLQDGGEQDPQQDECGVDVCVCYRMAENEAHNKMSKELMCVCITG